MYPVAVIAGILFFLIILPMNIWFAFLAFALLLVAPWLECKYWKYFIEHPDGDSRYDPRILDVIGGWITVIVLSVTAYIRGGKNFSLIMLPVVWIGWFIRTMQIVRDYKANKSKTDEN